MATNQGPSKPGQRVQVNAVGPGKVSHGWALVLNDHFDHSVRTFARCVNVWKDKINCLNQLHYCRTLLLLVFAVRGIAPSLGVHTSNSTKDTYGCLLCARPTDRYESAAPQCTQCLQG